VQEVVLSPEAQVYVSRRDFSWAEFIRFCRLVASEINTAERLEIAALIAEKLSQSTMLSLHRQRTDKSGRSFPDLIKNYCICRCFDLRDRVFGLMGLVRDFAIEIDYGLSRLQLFEKVTHTYPAQFAEDLADVLWIALEGSSEIDLTSNVQSSLTIPVRVQECGSVVRQDGKLTWSQHPKQILLSYSYLDDAIDEGDRLYSLFMTPGPARRGDRRFLIVLRDQRFQNDTSFQTPKSNKTSYSVAGTALVFHPSDELGEGFSSNDLNLDRSLLGAQMFRDAQSVGYGPLIMKIPMRAFVQIGYIYRFRQSNRSPYYDGVTNPDHYSRSTYAKNRSPNGAPLILRTHGSAPGPLLF
jgi:hypothetical protein